MIKNKQVFILDLCMITVGVLYIVYSLSGSHIDLGLTLVMSTPDTKVKAMWYLMQGKSLLMIMFDMLIRSGKCGRKCQSKVECSTTKNSLL